jgi:hypothetical protein
VADCQQKKIAMIKSLRKRHLQIWLVLAVLLPAGIISGWIIIPEPVKDRLLQPAASRALPVLLKTSDKINYTANLKSNSDTSVLQLELITKNQLTFPSALIYEISNEQKNIENGNIIGRIDAQGVYRFPLKKEGAGKNMHFVLYDIIHHQIIDRINF